MYGGGVKRQRVSMYKALSLASVDKKTLLNFTQWIGMCGMREGPARVF